MPVLDRIVAFLGLDPFSYLVVTILGVAGWILSNVLGNVALTGRGLWLRRASVLVAGLGVVLFTYTASHLR